jgi:hypothetical protein
MNKMRGQNIIHLAQLSSLNNLANKMDLREIGWDGMNWINLA